MSRCCCRSQVSYAPQAPVVQPRLNSNCICNFPTLVILILIILQFSKGCKKDYDCDDEESRTCCGGINIIDNGVLFIIALFFLSCSGCGKGAYGTY